MRITDVKESQVQQKLIYDAQGIVITEHVEAGEQNAEKNKENAGVFSQKAATLEISRQSMDFWKQQMEALRESNEAAEKATQDIAKIMEIARRISKGDKVPGSDEQKLMEYSMEMYQSAKMMAMMHENEKHKEHEALFDEEDEGMEEKLRDLNREGSPVQTGAVSTGTESAVSEFTITE